MAWDPQRFTREQRHAATLALQYAQIELVKIRKVLFGAVSPISEFDRRVEDALTGMVNATDPGPQPPPIS